jgi:tetratricopeptide (TPR) repeat protein
MIVKNEEEVIERLLKSVIPIIKTWVIVDTGSTDRTKEIIQSVMDSAGIPGTLFDRQWVDFGANRTEALRFCDGVMDWAFMMDADDTLEGDISALSPGEWSDASADAVLLSIHHGSLVHERPHIFKTGIGWCYQGTVHEAAVCSSKPQSSLLRITDSVYITARCEGSRSKDPSKYLKDAELLESELAKTPNHCRTLFYLAQSYRDGGRPLDALRYYKRYFDTPGGWDQERYITCVEIIKLTPDADERRRIAWFAIELCPNRAEAPYYYLQARRQMDGHKPLSQQDYAIGACCITSKKVRQGDLFVTPIIYKYLLDDEFSIVAGATGHLQESLDAQKRCIENAPNEQFRENAKANARRIFDKIISG